MPNVILNSSPYTPPEDPSDESELDLSLASADGRVKYFHGDWGSLPSLLSSPYDLVLTSETIYSRDSHEPLLDAIEATLSRTGIALVAAKRNYFGLSGTLFDFLRLVEARGRMGTARVFEAGNVGREIWELRWK